MEQTIENYKDISEVRQWVNDFLYRPKEWERLGRGHFRCRECGHTVNWNYDIAPQKCWGECPFVEYMQENPLSDEELTG